MLSDVGSLQDRFWVTVSFTATMGSRDQKNNCTWPPANATVSDLRNLLDIIHGGGGPDDLWVVADVEAFVGCDQGFSTGPDFNPPWQSDSGEVYGPSAALELTASFSLPEDTPTGLIGLMWAGWVCPPPSRISSGLFLPRNTLGATPMNFCTTRPSRVSAFPFLPVPNHPQRS